MKVNTEHVQCLDIFIVANKHTVDRGVKQELYEIAEVIPQ